MAAFGLRDGQVEDVAKQPAEGRAEDMNDTQRFHFRVSTRRLKLRASDRARSRPHYFRRIVREQLLYRLAALEMSGEPTPSWPGRRRCA